MTHERTLLGRELLRLQRDIRAWIALNSACETGAAIEAAERLACELSAAARNGLDISKHAYPVATHKR